MPDSELGLWARRLLADLDARTPWRSFVPPDGMTSGRAYALQEEVARLREDRGERVIGYKMGCTSAAIQEQLGIREPIFGRLFDTGCLPDGSRISHPAYAKLAIEGELAIRLSRDLPSRSGSDDDFLGAIESVFPVIELHHYDLPVNTAALPALIACGGMHAGFVRAGNETAWSGLLPKAIELDVVINDSLAGTATNPWTMGGPQTTLHWLTARLAESGAQLRPGQVILSGSVLPLFPVEPSSRVVVRAQPLGQSSVTID